MHEMTPLDELARKHETDKGGYHLRYGGGDSDTCHAYCWYYHQMFEHLRDKPIDLLEIGVNRGCSLKMWAEYFPKAQILGIDSSGECMKGGRWSLLTMRDTRITTVPADQNNARQLWDAVGKRTFDIIIDDGSHERPHQLVSMYALLPSLKPGGLYVVEDLGPNFKDHELMEPAADLAWDYTVIPIEGGRGKADCIEHLVVVERPL